MSKKRIVCFLVMGCMLLLFAGCGKKEPQTATLTVTSNPSTGFEWFVEQDPELFDVASAYEEAGEGEDEDEALTGVAGTEIFTLTPKAEGSTTVNFYYERSWEDEEPEARLTYNVKIDKNMQITVESSSFELPGDSTVMPEIPELVIE